MAPTNAHFRYSAAAEFASSQWKSVNERAHFTMQEDGSVFLIDPTSSATSCVEIQTAETIQQIESTRLPPFEGDVPAAEHPVQIASINTLNDTRLSSVDAAARKPTEISSVLVSPFCLNETSNNIIGPLKADDSMQNIVIAEQKLAKFDRPVTSSKYLGLVGADTAEVHRNSDVRLGCNKQSIPSNANDFGHELSQINSGTAKTRFMIDTISYSGKKRGKASPVNKDKFDGKKWIASTKPENPDGPIKPLPLMDNYRRRMNAPREKVDKLLKTIKANKKEAIARINDTDSELRLPDEEQFKQTEEFGWVCQDENVYSSLPPMGNKEEYKAQYMVSNIKLGEGASGLVCLGWRRSDDKEVAIKKIKKSQEKIRFAGNVNGKIYPIEYCHLQMLSGTSGISNILDAFEVDDEYILILETMEDCMSLESFLKSRQRLPERHCKFIFHQLVDAVAQCHNEGVFHRDIKLSNILIDTDSGEVKLIDFDSSALACFSPFMDNPGTIGYMSPEMDDESIRYEGSPAAVYSMGVVLYDLIFYASRWKLLIKRLPMPDVSTDCLDLICKMTASRPEDRISFDKILDHPWMKFH